MNSTQITSFLKDKPWKSFLIDNDQYFIKSAFDSESYSLLITDLVMVWFKYSSQTQTLKDKMKYNPHLDTKTEKIIELLSERMIKKNEDTNYTVKIDSHFNIRLTITTKISFYTFKWNFDCEPLEKDTILSVESRKIHSQFIRDNFTIPLLYIHQDQQNEINLLQKKLQQQQQQQQSHSINQQSVNINTTNVTLTQTQNSNLIKSKTKLNNLKSNTQSLSSSNNSSINQEEVKFTNKSFDLSGERTLKIFTNYHEYLANTITLPPPLDNSFNNSSNNSNNNNDITNNNTSLDTTVLTTLKNISNDDNSENSLQLYYEETPKKQYSNVRNPNNNKTLSTIPFSLSQVTNLAYAKTTAINYDNDTSNNSSKHSLTLSNWNEDDSNQSNYITSSFDTFDDYDTSYSDLNNTSRSSNNENLNNINLQKQESEELKRRLEIQERIENDKNKIKKKKIRFI